MRLLAALVRWELRLQLRSLRPRAAVLVYLALASAPSVMFFFLSRHYTFGPASFLHNLLAVQPFLTVLLAVLVTGHRSAADAWGEMWPVLASARVGNAGYLLGRWIALLVLIVPVTVLPMAIAAGASVAAGGESYDPASWIWPWALEILPVAVVASALWLGSVTILGSELAALGVTVVGSGIALHFLNEVLFRWHLHVEGAVTMGSYTSFGRWMAMMGYLAGRERDIYAGNFAASEAPFDPWQTFMDLLPQSVVASAAAALALGLAVAFVHRTRRDLKPRPIRPGHPLRTYLQLVVRMREQLAPAAALGRTDRLLMVCGVAVLAGCLGFSVERQLHFQELASKRYQVEGEDPVAPMPPDVKPVSWWIRAQVETSGALVAEVRSSLANEGTEPHGQLGFALDEHLEVEQLDVAGRQAVSERHWDRVLVRLDPPLEPAETVELRWRISGTPGEIEFPFWHRSGDSFVAKVEKFRGAVFPRDLTDLSQSRFVRAVSSRRVGLEAAHLAPVPRYAAWTLTPPSDDLRTGRQVPEETVLHEMELELELEAPPQLFLADVRGQASRVEEGRSRLRSRCRTVLSEYAIFGGPLRVVEGDGATFAALPVHQELAASYRESLGTAARLSDKAWPGLPGFEGLVAVERIRPIDTSGRWWKWGGFELRGRLLLVQEKALGMGHLPEAENLVADLLTRDLVARRSIDTTQDFFFYRVFRSLMLRRMGVSQQQDATLAAAPPWIRSVLEKPLLEADASNGLLWNRRLPAVLIDLESRVGSRQLFDGIEAFLNASGGEPGTIEELIATLEEASGVELDRFLQDFILGVAVPELELAGVEATRVSNGFRVNGRVRNTGTGEVVCPVLVKTEVGTVAIRVTVGSESDTAFDVRTTTRPHTLLLDPEGTCHRLVTPARVTVESADLMG